MKLSSRLRALAAMVLLCAGSLVGAPSDSTPTAKKTLLVLANLEGNENLGGHFVDPTLEKALVAKGWRMELRGLHEVGPGHYAAADAVVYYQQPYAANRAGVATQRAFAPGFVDFLKSGGNTLVLFDDRYFQVFEPVNEWLEPLGAKLVREQLFDSNAANTGVLKVDREIAYVLTRNLNREHPVTRDIEVFAAIKRVGGELTYPLVVDASWTPLVSGEKTARSEDTWARKESSYPSAPVLIATRPVGKGSLTVSGIHSTGNFLHGSHRRFDGGFFLRNGNAAFLLNWIEWAGSRSVRTTGAMPPKTSEGAALIELKPVTNQVPRTTWQRGFILDLAERPSSLDAWRAALHGRVDWVAVSVAAEAMPDAEQFAAWRAMCEAASDERLRFYPAGRVRDSFGNAVVVIAPETWPVRRHQRAVNHIAREINGHPVLVDVHRNPWPVENIGGFQGFPLATYRDGVCDFDLTTFRFLQAEDWFLIPHVVVEGSSPEAVSGLLDRGMYLTHVPAESPARLMEHLPYLFHNPRVAFVSKGPRILRAALAGPGLVEDPWEGEYYLWSGSNDEARYHAVVEGLGKGAQVRVYRNRLLWRQYPAKAGRWELDLPFQSTEASHSYWMEVWSGAEPVAVSTASRSRPGRHSAHGGGDRMNLYHSMAEPGPDGNLMMRGERVFHHGFYGFNTGWGDTLDLRPPVKARDWTPDGYEWGFPTLGVSRLRLTPHLRLPGGAEFGVAKPRRAGYALSSEEMVILRETVDRKEVTIDGKRGVAPTTHLSAHTTYAIPPWTLDGVSTMLVTTTLRTKRDVTIPPGEPVRWVEVITRSPKSWATLSLRSGGAWRHLERNGTASHTGRFEAAALWPDPLQSFALIPQPGATTTFQIRDTRDQGPVLALSTPLAGGDWDENSPITFSYLYAASAGETKDIEAVLEPALALWSPKDTSKLLNLSRGRLRDWFGFPRVAAEGAAVAYRVGTIPERLVLPVEIDGLNERWPAWLAGDSWRPLAQLEDKGYATHRPAASGATFRAGSLVTVSEPSIQIDVRRLGDGAVNLWVHNPTARPLRFEIAPVLATGKPQTLRLNPGEDREVRFKLLP